MLKITRDLIKQAGDKIDFSKRGRGNYNFHKDYNEPLQRMLNIANRNTYIRPHKHENPDKIEIFVILEGKVLLVEFDNNGKVIDCIVLDAQKGKFAVEISPRAWHSFICLEDGSCLYEIKEGPYAPNTDKNFALWAPPEATEEAELFNKKILRELKLDFS